MMKHLSLLLTTTALFLLPNIAKAQTYNPSNRNPVADNSIGTIVNPTGTNNNFNIEGGLQRGQNLFHSFTDFSIPTGGAANFTNPAGNQSIITRVTGNFISDLNGTLNTNGANFLLINPNGVVFGTNARLNVGKAFVTSTASGVDFVDAAGRNYNFGVNRAGDALLISIAPNVAFSPARLIMNASIPGSKGIENYGTLQTNNPGQYIGLIGGDVTFNGGKIIAPGAKVELGGLVQSGTIGFSLDNGVQFPANVDRGNVSLVTIGTLPSIIDVRSGGGGSVRIVAKDLTVQGTGTRIRVGIATGLGSPTATAGDIKLDATGNVSFSDAAAIVNLVNPGAEGKGGEIDLVTGNLSVTNGAVLAASTYGKGDAGNIKITATGNVSFDGSKDGFFSQAISTVEQGAVGKGGRIEMSVRSLSVTNGGQLVAATRGQGDAGNIKITATGNVSFDGGKDGFNSAAFSSVEQGAVGKGGGIDITTRNLSVTNGAQLLASTRGQGDAGNIKITATGNVSFDGSNDAFDSGSGGMVREVLSGALSVVEQGAVGKGGGIDITTRNLFVTNGARLQALTNGRGDSGNVKITATDNISFDGSSKDGVNSGTLSAVAKDGVGKGGGIDITTRDLSVTRGSVLLADTIGQGDAGNIKITATGNVSVDGNSELSSSVKRNGVGKGGSIEIITGNLSVTNGSQLVAATIGKGDAGNIKITATDTVSFDGSKDGFGSGAVSTVERGGVGKGGGIDIITRDLSVTNIAVLSSSTKGQGDAGNIKITATGTVSFDGSKDGYSSGAASTVERGGVGKGGGIDITTRDLSVTNGAGLTASSLGQGDAGDIFIKSNTINLNKSEISSKSSSSRGGNINLFTTDYLLLRNNSFIATDSDSTGQNGNGGNITINSPLIIATPGNNDITANAYQGDGGRVNITSQGLFGIQYRPIGTDFTNDITASSTFGQSGSVQINTPGIDPGKDTGELPAAPNDASNQISQTCGASQRENKFYITGRGGLPPNASEPQESEALWQDARTTKPKPATTATQPAQLAPPAIGWVFERDGKVRLIAAQIAGGTTGTRVVCPSKK